MTISMEEVSFTILVKDGIPLVKVNREHLDLTSADELTKILNEAASKNQGMVVDFATVTYIDSVIISTIVKFFIDERNNGHRLVLFDTGKHIDDLLETTRLKSILDIGEDIDEAIKIARTPLTDAEIAMYSQRHDS